MEFQEVFGSGSCQLFRGVTPLEAEYDVMAPRKECLADGGSELRMSRRRWLGATNVLQMLARSDECLEDGGLE